MGVVLFSRLLLIHVFLNRARGFPSSTPQLSNTGSKEKCGLYGSCDLTSQFCDQVLATCEDCWKVCTTENALCSEKCQAYLQKRTALSSAPPSLSQGGNRQLDFDAEWTTFKKQTTVFRSVVILLLSVLLTGPIAVLAIVCRRWLIPRIRRSICHQVSSPSAAYCSCSEKSRLAPSSSSSSSDVKGEILPKSLPSENFNRVSAVPSLNHGQILNAASNSASRHSPRCVGLIGLTCGCNQGNMHH